MWLSAASRSDDSVEDLVFLLDDVVTVAQRTRGHGMMEMLWILVAFLFLTGATSDAIGLNLNTFDSSFTACFTVIDAFRQKLKRMMSKELSLFNCCGMSVSGKNITQMTVVEMYPHVERRSLPHPRLNATLYSGDHSGAL